MPHGRFVLPLTESSGAGRAVVGAKAANLARCAVAGLPAVDGFVLTTEAARSGLGDEAVEAALHRAWTELGGEDRRFVVRSSSTVEDAAESSMAGQFLTVLDVTGWSCFMSAVEDVLRSAERSASGSSSAPMAVLVQLQLDARFGGVLFGADPVNGAVDRWVVEAVQLRPDELVSGRVVPLHLEMDDEGVELSRRGAGCAALDDELIRDLLDLGRRCRGIFGGPQDIEWAVDADGSLRLLQCRPCTALADPPSGRTFVTGPVAETFPSPLRDLEVDLWVEPFRNGVRRALRRIGAVEPGRLDESPVVVVVGGRVAIDDWSQDTPGGPEPHRSRRQFLVRRLRATAVVPIQAVHAEVRLRSFLRSTSSPMQRSVSGLLADLHRSRTILALLHELEVCSGALVVGGRSGASAAGSALRHLHQGRRTGLGDQEVVERWPAVLALVPPSLSGSIRLPRVDAPGTGGRPWSTPLSLRERLKVWIRVLQHRQSEIAAEIGRLLVARGVLETAADAGDMSLEELRAAGAGQLPVGRRTAARPPAPPLPARFRLTAGGEVVAARTSRSDVGGIGAGGGRAEGVVSHSVRVQPNEPVVLVVEHLTPDLAASLPMLAALVSETGGVLSHLAILARELSVPTVVGVPDARRRFPEGTRVLVDGRSGGVEVVAATGAFP